MIEAILSKLAESGVKEIASKGSETMIKDFPKNLRNLKPEDIRDYKDADKPLHKGDDTIIGENKEKSGGAYKDLPSKEESEKHHMPADSTTELPYGDGPAIVMEKDDHRETASCGNSKEAQEYRAKQKELIDEGKFKEAQQMDIDDIRDKFGDKYDDQISELSDYTDDLLENGKGV